MQAGLGSSRHQCMVAGVKLHLVGTSSKPVVAVQLRGMHIGQTGMGLHASTAHELPQALQIIPRQTRSIVLQSTLQCQIA